MRHRAIAGAMVGATVALATVWACSVDRRTPALACSPTATCAAGRVCVEGYCVEGAAQDARIDSPPPSCPMQCDSCDFAMMKCNITGHGGGGDINCPAGWACAITCSQQGACGDIDCQQGRSCDVTCGAGGACRDIDCGTVSCTTHCTGDGSSTACGLLTCTTGACDATCIGDHACNDITCGTGRCTATCTGSNACGNVTCPSSCRCDVTCGPGECGTNTCPMAPMNKFCTQNGSNGQPCYSMFAQQCHKC